MTEVFSSRIWSPDRLRRKYFLRGRFSQGFVSAAPWINVILLLIMFLALENRVVLQPGVVVDLPGAAFVDGTQPGLVAVILHVSGTADKPPREMVFFEDERFFTDTAEQMENLRRALEKQLRDKPDAPLVILADRRVPHGTVVEIVNLAREVGLRFVNVATRPE
ncbi:MAG: ExbD/TolR family protein [Kiritimatiellia bacterium]